MKKKKNILQFQKGKKNLSGIQFVCFLKPHCAATMVYSFAYQLHTTRINKQVIYIQHETCDDLSMHTWNVLKAVLTPNILPSMLLFGQLSLKLVSSTGVRGAELWCHQCLPSFQGSAPADCSHLPIEQRRKKLQNRIHHIGQEILREREQRWCSLA